MSDVPSAFEEAARIVEGYAEEESDERVLELLAEIAGDIRARLLND
jgi:hypothetical protein